VICFAVLACMCMRVRLSVCVRTSSREYADGARASCNRRMLVCCSVLQCVAMCFSVLQCAAVCCSVVQCVAVCCSVVQRGAVCFSVVQ